MLEELLLQVGVVCVHGWELKSINHLFCECPLAVQLWSGFGPLIGNSFVETMEYYLRSVLLILVKQWAGNGSSSMGSMDATK